jgi:lipopolysaccharide transport system permease protein
LNPFSFLWRHRRLILHTTRSDLQARYTGSVLGLAWAVINPLLLLSVYLVLYVVILGVRLPGRPSGLEYALVIFTGLIPWFGFSEATVASVASVVANANLLHNTSFPAPVLPVKAVFASLGGQAIGLTVLLVALAVTGHSRLSWLWLPLAMATQLLLSLGLGWILSAVNVFVRDLAQAMSALLLVLMFASPIAFTADFLAGTRLRILLLLNPISSLINLYRGPLLYGQAPALLDLVLGPLLALLVFLAGFRFFVRIRPHLTDHV